MSQSTFQNYIASLLSTRLRDRSVDEAAIFRDGHEIAGIVSLHLQRCFYLTVGWLISEVELPRGTKDILIDDFRKLRLDAKEFLSDVLVLDCRQACGPIFEIIW